MPITWTAYMGYDAARLKEMPMSTFQVRVEAKSVREAAEMRYGRELSEVGTNHQLRALVHQMRWPRRPSPILFYDRG